MNCSEFRERVFDRDPVLDAHAASCAACAGLRSSIESEARVLSHAGAPRAPENLWRRIESAIARPRWPGWAAAAAAGLIAAVGILLFAGKPVPKPAPGLPLVIVEASPESASAFSGMVPSYDDVDPNTALRSTIVGPEERRR